MAKLFAKKLTLTKLWLMALQCRLLFLKRSLLTIKLSNYTFRM